MRFRNFCWLLPLLCIACSCQNPAGRPATTARVIIGFDETASPPGRELLARLGGELGCELQTVQQIGGNAYVYNCVTAEDEASLTRKLDGLGQHKGVRYAEMDRKRKIQN